MLLYYCEYYFQVLKCEREYYLENYKKKSVKKENNENLYKIV